MVRWANRYWWHQSGAPKVGSPEVFHMLSKTWHKTLAAGLMAVALVGGTIGLANAQTAPAPTPSPLHQVDRSQLRQQYVDALAKRLGVTSAQLEQAAEGARSDVGAPSHGSGPHEAEHG